tara:strand:+ start:882 stop:1037 length:156 start_codon:yes stop_codon:yes gene_type:complete
MSREKNFKHLTVSEEVYNKIINHLEEKEYKVFISSWVEKACNDLIKKEKGE